ncbi:hypothetical protein ACO1O0_004380 [Amphichorda felina]
MKTVAIALGALAALVAAQEVSGVPECGHFCINDMMNGKASELGCATKDLACLCANKDFAYGLRDCSAETCGSDKAGAVVAYGVKICEKAGVEITNAPTDGSPTATGGSGNTGSASTSSPATGGAGGLVTTITSDGTTIVTTLSTKTSAAGSETPGMSTVTSGVSKATSATESGTGGAKTSETGTGDATKTDTEAGSETGGATESDGAATTTTEPGAAMPQRTAASAGIIAAAGLAALML